MLIDRLIKNNNLTKYKLSKMADIPHATLSDICSGKTKIENCSVMTIYKLTKALNISMDKFLDLYIKENETIKEIERSYEYGLPSYLQYDLDEYKKALENNSTLLDCYWGELYSSINIAEVSEGIITKEHAEYLRNKYLWKKNN